MMFNMKGWRQQISLILVLVVSLTLVGCGGSSFEKVSTSESEDEQNAFDTTSILETNNENKPDEETEELTSIVSTSEEIVETVVNYEEEEQDDGLTSTMRNSINMLNYMISLTQQVNQEKSNQLFLESAYNSFENLYPNSVDTKTQAQIISLMDTIQNYRMITVKRDRLEYIYEQNRAQAFRQAIPNPVGLLSAVQSGNILQASAAVLYMAVDSASSYMEATSQADLQFIKDGWELDDSESAELHDSTKNALTYMLDMVRDYEIPGDYALNKGAIEDFVSWSNKPDLELERKISWFETNRNTYSEFGPYWLELAKDYYNNENYEKCLDSVNHYESISTRIFRKDLDYANTLPMAIVSAKNTMNNSDYVKQASKYCKVIYDNTKDEDWALRYFIAQIYMDLYSITDDSSYLDEAYRMARENAVVLIDEQKKLNRAYLSDVKEEEANKDATKREKEEVKKYNKTIKAERKIALPPVSEALYLNVDLLFALAEERSIDESEKKKVEEILHPGSENLFLTQDLDDRFWFDKTMNNESDSIEVLFEGEKIIIPASCVTDRSTISVTVSGSNGTTVFDEWIVDEVKRPKNSTDCAEFTVSFVNKDAGKHKYKAGDIVIISVTPVAETPDKHRDFTFNVVKTKKAVVVNGLGFERVK